MDGPSLNPGVSLENARMTVCDGGALPAITLRCLICGPLAGIVD
eukprot:CAMPEP_0202707356 /NCGR_PEP_ID=MMETSP1385-20130828/19699_1 /ASSEMBLY_ACC=CAM_ASM_000861 /TAXON_ID=933848 /ORGANISM="Elphidium margaritaceum" /LENGTH=43 /DNA_ID= /DNA_START= /DNA_END= /DNA_ORIENTATION=